MNDMLVPDWIKEIEAENALKKSQDDASHQRQLAASLKVDKESPQFWKQLLKELTWNLEALPKIDCRGQVSPHNIFNPDSENGCRIAVSVPGIFPKQTYTDLYWRRGTQNIRCQVLNGGVFNLVFCVSDGHVFVLPENDSDVAPMTAEKTAEFLVKKMVMQLKTT